MDELNHVPKAVWIGLAIVAVIGVYLYISNTIAANNSANATALQSLITPPSSTSSTSSTDLSSINDSLTQLQNAIDSISASSSGNATSLSSLTTAVQTVQNDISQIQTNQGSNNAQLNSQLSSDMSTLQSLIAANGSQLSTMSSTLANAISALQSQLSSQVSSIQNTLNPPITNFNPYTYTNYFSSYLNGLGFMNYWNGKSINSSQSSQAQDLFIQALQQEFPGLKNVPLTNLQDLFYNMFIGPNHGQYDLSAGLSTSQAQTNQYNYIQSQMQTWANQGLITL